MDNNMDKIVKTLIKKAFTEYDLDSSGYLERPEMGRFVEDSCKEVGVAMVNEQHLDRIIAVFDLDKDGKVSIKEFSELLRPMIEKQLGMSA